jgi:hypothetical protein
VSQEFPDAPEYQRETEDEQEGRHELSPPCQHPSGAPTKQRVEKINTQNADEEKEGECARDGRRGGVAEATHARSKKSEER